MLQGSPLECYKVLFLKFILLAVKYFIGMVSQNLYHEIHWLSKPCDMVKSYNIHVIAISLVILLTCDSLNNLLCIITVLVIMLIGHKA